MLTVFALVIPSIRDFIIAILIVVVLGFVYGTLIEPNITNPMFKSAARLLVGIALAVGICVLFGLV